MNKKVAIIAGALVIGVAGAFAILGRGTTAPNELKKTNEVVTIVDGNGEVEVKKNPTRVVTFDYGTLDILDNMGVDIVGLPKSSIPSSLSKFKDEKYKNLGDLKEPDFEAVSSLNPELIIISGRQKDLYDEFAKIAPTIYLNVNGDKYMDDFSNNLTALAKIFDKEDFAKETLEKINTEIETVNSKVKAENLTASTVMVNEGNLSAFADKSRFALIYNQLGFENIDPNIEESNHGQQITFEYLVEKNPDYIFVIDRGSATGGDESAKALFNNELIKSTKAYANDNIVYLSSQAWYVIAGGITSTETMINDVSASVK